MHSSLRRYLWTPRWRRLRQVALERDGWRCTLCGRAGRLEVHHVQPTSEGGAVWDLANLRTLCRPCHFEQHREARRKQRLSMMADAGRRKWWEFIGGA